MTPRDRVVREIAERAERDGLTASIVEEPAIWVALSLGERTAAVLLTGIDGRFKTDAILDARYAAAVKSLREHAETG